MEHKSKFFSFVSLQVNLNDCIVVASTSRRWLFLLFFPSSLVADINNFNNSHTLRPNCWKFCNVRLTFSLASIVDRNRLMHQRIENESFDFDCGCRGRYSFSDATKEKTLMTCQLFKRCCSVSSSRRWSWLLSSSTHRCHRR